MRTIERTTAFKKDYKREWRGRHAKASMRNAIDDAIESAARLLWIPAINAGMTMVGLAGFAPHLDVIPVFITGNQNGLPARA